MHNYVLSGYPLALYVLISYYCPSFLLGMYLLIDHVFIGNIGIIVKQKGSYNI